MIMMLGPFPFMIETQLLQRMNDDESARIATMDRAGSFPAKQFLGPGDREIELNSTIYKEVLSPAGPAIIELMRIAMRIGKRMPLVTGSGHFYGMYMIKQLRPEKTHVLPNGTFQKIELTMTLTRAPVGFEVAGIPLF